MIENDDNLLNDLEDKYLNKKRRCNKCCKILSLILIIILITIIIIFIIIFISNKKNIGEEKNEIKEKELKEINEIKKEINEREKVLNEKDKEIKEKEKQITDKELELKVKDIALADKEIEIKDKEKLISDKEKDLKEKEKIITEREKELKEEDKIIKEKEILISEKEKQITDEKIQISDKEKQIAEKEKQITDKEIELKEKDKIIKEKEKSILEKEKLITEKEALLSEKEKQIKDEEIQIADKEKKLKEKEITIAEKEKVLIEKEKLISDKEKQITNEEIQIKDKEIQIINKIKQITDKEGELKEKDKIIIEKEKVINSKEKEINEREKVIKEKEKEIEELNKHPYLDTIPDEELKQARNSFNQNIFINPDNSKIDLSYNFFIPENYTSDIIYPLIVFIGDESTYGKEIILPINKTVGGPIWATKTVQEKHKCFILVPHFNENIFNNNNESLKNEYTNMIIRLIYKIKNEYNIDLNRIYGTGQSIGADIILYLIIKNQNIFAGSLIISPINVNKTLITSTNTPFTYFDSLENLDSLIKQYDIINYFNYSNIAFNSIRNINPQENITLLNQNINNNLYNQEYKFNFITYSKRNDYQTENNNKNELYKYGFRPEAVREWLFSQNKIKCDKEYYYSEEKGKCFSKTKKKIYFISYTKGDLLTNLLKNCPFISKVDIGKTDINSKITKEFLESYDCIIYDLKDGANYTSIKKEKENEIRSYINSGGSFLVTHDKWDEDEGPLDLIGLYRWGDNKVETSMSTKAKVSRFGHSIFDSYYNLTDWRIIDISETHKSFHKIINEKNTARVVMEFDKDIETGYKLDYLTVNKVGKGRIAYWAAGHHYNISDYEQKLFINIISWLTKNKQ